MNYIVLLSLHAATICMLFAILFIYNYINKWIAGLTVFVGIFSLALPLYMLPGTLGYPDPWPQGGDYRLLGWDVEETNASFYVFVTKDDEKIPRHYKLPFELKSALWLQELLANKNIYESLYIKIIPIAGNSHPEYELYLKERDD